MAYIRATQAPVESRTCPIVWVGYMCVGCAIDGASRSLRCGSGGKLGLTGVELGSVLGDSLCQTNNLQSFRQVTSSPQVDLPCSISVGARLHGRFCLLATQNAEHHA